MNKKRFLKIEDLYKLSSTIHNNFSEEYDISNLILTFEVDEDTMKRINEEIFYANNPNTKTKPEETDEIIININDVHFRYTINNEIE